MTSLAAASVPALVGAACASIWFVGVLKPSSTGAWVFLAAWLTLPHAALGALLARRRTGAPIHMHVVAITVAAGGILYLADTVFWHPDAQGAIAVVMLPLLQGAALILLLPAAGWMARRARQRPGGQ